MTTATRLRDPAHARIYCHWFLLPAWHNLSAHARAILVEMLATFRPGTNGYLEWQQSRVAKTLHCGNAKADAVMVELEKAGWIEVTRVGTFAGARQATLYRLTTQPCDRTGQPASLAFQKARPQRPGRANKNQTGAKKNRTRFQLNDCLVPTAIGKPANDAPVHVSAALRMSLKRKGYIA